MCQARAMTPIPVLLRRRILQLYERDKSTREIAQLFGFCVAAVRRVRQQFRQRGTLEPRTHRSGRRSLLTDERKRRLAELLSAQPDATLAELGARLDRPFRASTVDLWLRRLGWRYKKNSGRRRAKPPGRGRKKSALA
jgi:transposase